MAGTPIGSVQAHLRTLLSAGVVGCLSDAELLDRCADRSGELAEHAFAALVQRHGPLVWRVCRIILRDVHAAEDAFQATFLVLSRRADSIRRPGLLGNWLYGVAHRTAIKARAKSTQRRNREASDLDDAAYEVADESGRPERLAIRAETIRIVHEEMGRLAEQDRAALLLCDLEGCTLEQAAGRAGCSVGVLRGRLARSRVALRRRLTRRGLGLPAGVLIALIASEHARAAAPHSLVRATLRAALWFAGSRIGTKIVRQQAVVMAEGVLRFMKVSQLKSAGATMLGACVVATGLSGLAGRLPIAAAADDRARSQPGPADKTEATSRVGAPAAQAEGEFELAAGCKWHLDPKTTGIASWASRGVSGIVEVDKDGALTVTLAHAGGSDQPSPSYRPVVFDRKRKRHIPRISFGGASTDKAGATIALYRYRLDPAELPAGEAAHVGVESVTPEARRIEASRAIERAKKTGVEYLPKPRIGDPLEFTLTTIDGAKVQSRDLRGKVVVIDCWATWCSPCMAKMPFLKDFYEKHHDEGFEVVGVSFDHDVKTVETALKVLRLPWPQVLVAADDETRELWQVGTGIDSLPRILVIDRDGILHANCDPKELEPVALKLLRCQGSGAGGAKP
jgi:RNA polymerase sigma factor (sigma-70 family)